MLLAVRNGRYLRKEVIAALLIALGCTTDKIIKLTEKAGFVLSGAIASDVVAMWMLDNNICNNNRGNLVKQINYELNTLALPLLMSRDRSRKNAH